jgi:uncharacterized caspase-like protein
VKSRHHFGFSLVLVLAGLVWASPGLAQSRVALVIGNTAYEHTRVLPNARNDAEALAALLERIGFKVTLAKDLGYRPMREAIRAFGRAAAGAEIAAVYFAGHGLEVGGENWLVPTDAKLVSDADLDYEAVTLVSLLDALKARGKLGLVILDACRNNPIADRMKLRAGVTRSVNRGLGRPDPAADMLIAYSAKAGTLAQDGTGRHSPYAAALLAHLATPGLDVRLVFGHVRDAVLAATTNVQQPDIYVSLGGSAVTLVPGTERPPPPPHDRPPSPSGPSEVERAWARIENSRERGNFEAFLRQYGRSNPFYDQLAQKKIALLDEEARKAADVERLRPDRIFRSGSTISDSGMSGISA